MRMTWDELRTEYDQLVEMLSPWPRLTSSEEIGALLKINGGYIRILRSASTKKPSEMPSPRICERVVNMKEYVASQVTAEPDLLIQIGERLAFPRKAFNSPDPSQQLRFVAINGIGQTAEPVPVEISGEVRGYWVYAPEDWIRNCNNRECGKLFISRFNGAYCGPTCRRAEHNRRQRERRAVQSI